MEVFWPCLRADVEPLGQWLHEHFGQPVPLSPQNQQLSFKGNIPASNKPPNSTGPSLLLLPTTFQTFCTCCPGDPCQLPHLRPVPTTHPPTASGTYPRAQSTGWKGPPSPGLALLSTKQPCPAGLSGLHLVTHPGCISGDCLSPVGGEWDLAPGWRDMVYR